MKCPFCGSHKTKVIDSRAVDEGGAIRRRRCCPECGSRFTTFERREKIDVMVVKRDGTGEPYNRQKIATGFYKALSKRDVPETVIESTVDEIEDELKKRQEKEIAASEIGDMVMERLRRLDEVAYMRFASVYKNFGDVSEFQKELGELMPEQMDRPEALSAEAVERSRK
ncbi:MAG: transcriptional regulator NrdR [Candidatus Geothermincolia bacterium]